MQNSGILYEHIQGTIVLKSAVILYSHIVYITKSAVSILRCKLVKEENNTYFIFITERNKALV